MPNHSTYQARVAAGLCTYCGVAQAAVGLRCAPCAERVKAANAERAKTFRNAGVCVKCGAAPANDGRVYCGDCLAYFAERTRARKADAAARSGTPVAPAAPAAQRTASPAPALQRDPIALSNRQVKEADRIGGIELLIEWPAELGKPPQLDEDQDCEATAAERACAERVLQDTCRQHGLVLVDVRVARVRRPPPSGREYVHYLAAIITGRRWVNAISTREPKPMYALQ